MGRIAKPFFPWVGGKLFLLPYIFQLLPRRAPRLLEVCGGSGAVTLGLGAGYAPLRVYNDMDADLANLFRSARDRPLALLKELNFLPLHARADFELVLRFLNHEYDPMDYLEEELQIAEDYFPPMDRQKVKKLLVGRANLLDVQRATAYYLSIRYSYSATGMTFGGRSVELRRFLGLLRHASDALRRGSAVRPARRGNLCGSALSGGGKNVRARLCPPGPRPAPRLPVRPGNAGQPHRALL